MKTVLITGYNGFTGQYMAREMSGAGYRIVGVGSRPILSPLDGHEYYQINLLDKDSLDSFFEAHQPEIIIHLAAIAFVGHGNQEDFYKVNILGTRNLLSAIERSYVPRMVLLASSANVYGNNLELDNIALSETQQVNPCNDYAVSKLAMEYMAKLWCDKLPIIVTRPFNYTGVGQDANFLIPKIVEHFKQRKEFIELGNLDISRDFSDVRFVVQSYRALIEGGGFGETYNIASGKSHSLGEILNICSDLTNHKIEVRVNPAFVRENDVKRLNADNSKLLTIISADKIIPLKETIQWMLKS